MADKDNGDKRAKWCPLPGSGWCRGEGCGMSVAMTNPTTGTVAVCGVTAISMMLTAILQRMPAPQSPMPPRTDLMRKLGLGQ